MGRTSGRPLSDALAIETFLTDIGISFRSTQVKLIYEAELALGTGQKPTFSHRENRNPAYREEVKRGELRQRIVEELFTVKRLPNDDKIKLGYGGALPIAKDPVNEKQAFFVLGLPGSGKSTVVNKISEQYGAVVIDSDYAKRKLPEYDRMPGPANLVHEESVHVSFNGPNSLFTKCLAEGYNIVIPKVGSRVSELSELRDVLKEVGYKNHITLIELDRFEATKRAFNRFLKTKRYVPLGLIFDVYANDPLLAYYKHKMEWDSWGAISTSGVTPEQLEKSDDINPASLF
ncbi:MAG: ATP-binding protein [Nitrosospira sp.]|nr:ATP-binding protein [Nitrosospira sp.]